MFYYKTGEIWKFWPKCRRQIGLMPLFFPPTFATKSASDCRCDGLVHSARELFAIEPGSTKFSWPRWPRREAEIWFTSEKLEKAGTVDFKKHPARKVGTRFRQCGPKVPGRFAFPGARNPRICSISRFGKIFPAIFPGLSRSFPREPPNRPRKQPQPSRVFWLILNRHFGSILRGPVWLDGRARWKWMEEVPRRTSRAPFASLCFC